MGSKIAPARDVRLEAAFVANPHLTLREMSSLTGIPISSVHRWKKSRKIKIEIAENLVGGTSPTDTKIDLDVQQDKCILTTRSLDIKTLDEALKAGKVDQEIWEVDRHVINFWEVTTAKTDPPTTMTNCQVKVWLKPKERPIVELALEHLLDRLKGPKRKMPSLKADAIHLMVMSLYDHHFGKLAWAAETGEDYDLDIASVLFKGAVRQLAEKCKGFPVNKIMFPIGNDFLHVDNMVNTTAKGTPQDVDGRLPKIVDVAFDAIIDSVDILSKIAPVEIIFVKGNHDPQTSYFLVKILQAYFKDVEAVTVDRSPSPRKYRRHGATLLGFAHGDAIKLDKLPLLMAGEASELWHGAKHREIHTGHFHKKKEMQVTTGDTFGPVYCRTIPSLCGTDSWHHEHGFVLSSRAAEAFLYSLDEGYTGHVSVTADEALKAYKDFL